MIILNDEVKVFIVTLDAERQYEDMLAECTLQLAEASIISRALHAPQRRIRLTSRIALRLILSKILNVAPRSIDFGAGRHGKPFLLGGSKSRADVQFNVSHAGEAFAIAIGWGRAVGVDIEYTDRERDINLISQRWFHQREKFEISMAPEALQRSLFYRYWSLKEAYAKALGIGLSIPFSNFYFDIKREPSLFIEGRGDYCPRRWRFFSDEILGEYVLSIAARRASSTNLRLSICSPVSFSTFADGYLV